MTIDGHPVNLVPLPGLEAGRRDDTGTGSGEDTGTGAEEDTGTGGGEDAGTGGRDHAGAGGGLTGPRAPPAARLLARRTAAGGAGWPTSLSLRAASSMASPRSTSSASTPSSTAAC